MSPEDISLGSIPETLQGVRMTIALMQAMVKDAIDNIHIATATRILKTLGELVKYVRAFRFIPDPPGTETVKHPLRTMQDRGGDCEDLTVLFAALAIPRGIAVRYAVIASSERGKYNHVYPEVQDTVARKWHAVELLRDWPLGQAAPHVEKRTFSALPDSDTENFLRHGARTALSGITTGPLMPEQELFTAAAAGAQAGAYSPFLGRSEQPVPPADNSGKSELVGIALLLLLLGG